MVEAMPLTIDLLFLLTLQRVVIAIDGRKFTIVKRLQKTFYHYICIGDK
jgi:hypothetical protein